MAFEEYLKLVNITREGLNELAERIPERLDPMEPQPNLPFRTDEFDLKVTTNEQGEYIFVDRSGFNVLLVPGYFGFLQELNQHFVREDLTRNSFKRYQEVLRTYKSDDEVKVKQAKELGIDKVLIQPGAETIEILDYCRENGITAIEGCALVELSKL